MTTTEPINEVTVLGAGVMGAAIAAHLANAGVRVRLLDIPPKDAPAGDQQGAQQDRRGGPRGRAQGQAGGVLLAALRDARDRRATSRTISAEAVAKSDFIIEAVIENLAIKQKLYARIDELGGRAIITSNTSGLRIAELMQGRSDSFKQRFCITHFFNPPRYLKLVEIVAGPDDGRRDRRARRGAVRAAARQGARARQGHAELHREPHRHVRDDAHARRRRRAEGYTVEEVDMVFGPATGKPKSGVFRTADVVGLDTLVHVTKNCFDALPGDERRDVFEPPPVLKALVEKKWLGARPSRASTRRSATTSCSSTSRRWSTGRRRSRASRRSARRAAPRTSTRSCAACSRATIAPPRSRAR